MTRTPTSPATSSEQMLDPHQDMGVSLRGPIVVAAAAGFLDVSVMASYALGVAPEYWHFGALALKAALAFAAIRRPGSEMGIYLLIACIAVSTTPIILSENPNAISLLRVFAFCVSAYCTAKLIKPGLFNIYLSSAGVTISTFSLIFIAFAAFGLVDSAGGRFSYFGDSAANLGGEISAIGAIALTLCMRRRQLYVLLIPILICALLLQSRSAILSVSMCAAISAFTDENGKISSANRLALIVIAVSVFGALIYANADTFRHLFEQVFHTDDPYRGTSSGFVGREERWYFSKQLFEQNPIFGVGIGYFEENKIPTPHNFFLYMLAEGGIVTGAAFAASFGYCIFRLAKNSPGYVITLLALLPLMMFNDRFINLNPYPFIMYIVIFCLPVSSRSRMLDQIGKPSTASRFHEKGRIIGPQRKIY